MPDRTPEELIEAAQALEACLPELREDIAVLREQNRRHRRGLFLLGVGSALLAFTTAGVVYSLYEVEQAQDKAATVAQYQAYTCKSANDFRATQRSLWAYVIGESVRQAKEPLTSKELRTARALLDRVNTDFAARDCERLLHATGVDEEGIPDD